MTTRQAVRESRSPYSRDVWNWYDWVTYISMGVTSVLVIACLHGGVEGAKLKEYKGYAHFALWTSRMMCITLLLIWIKLFK